MDITKRKHVNQRKPLTKEDISAPSDFRHIFHIGYDPTHGPYTIENIERNMFEQPRKPLTRNTGDDNQISEGKEMITFGRIYEKPSSPFLPSDIPRYSKKKSQPLPWEKPALPQKILPFYEETTPCSQKVPPKTTHYNLRITPGPPEIPKYFTALSFHSQEISPLIKDERCHTQKNEEMLNCGQDIPPGPKVIPPCSAPPKEPLGRHPKACEVIPQSDPATIYPCPPLPKVPPRPHPSKIPPRPPTYLPGTTYPPPSAPPHAPPNNKKLPLPPPPPSSSDPFLPKTDGAIPCLRSGSPPFSSDPFLPL